MKKLFLSVFALLLASTVLISGCGREYSYGKIERDFAQTGGALSFVYDESTRTATFGGRGEVIAYYPEEPSIQRAAGNRIGFKIFAPCDVNDYSKATLKFQGSEFSGGTFMQTIYDKPQNYFILTPLVGPETDELALTVTWTQDARPQNYKIKIAKGTLFAPATQI